MKMYDCLFTSSISCRNVLALSSIESLEPIRERIVSVIRMLANVAGRGQPMCARIVCCPTIVRIVDLLNQYKFPQRKEMRDN